jgi:hypothetical protein
MLILALPLTCQIYKLQGDSMRDISVHIQVQITYDCISKQTKIHEEL